MRETYPDPPLLRGLFRACQTAAIWRLRRHVRTPGPTALRPAAKPGDPSGSCSTAARTASHTKATASASRRVRGRVFTYDDRRPHGGLPSISRVLGVNKGCGQYSYSRPSHRRMIVCSRLGPTAIIATGTSARSSRKVMYSWAALGSSSKVRHPVMSVFHPGSSS